MPTLDVFNSDAFSVRSMTAAILKAPHKPGRIGELGLFGSQGITTTTVQVEEMDGQLSLIQTSPRGGPAPDPLGKNARRMRSFSVPRLARESKVYADEIQNIRAFGSETEVQMVENIAAQRLATLRQMHEVTLEFHRIGAIKGTILDADGTTTLFNLFTEFGVTQQSLDIALGTATTNIRNRCVAALRLIEAELGGATYSGARAFCSPEFFDAFIANAKVEDSFKVSEGLVLRQDLRTGFLFGGIIWEEYRGSVNKPDGSAAVTFVPANEALLVPEGVLTEKGPLFQTNYAPADFEDTVNTMGLPIYARNSPDPEFAPGQGRFRKIHSQSNPLCLCLRPRAVIKITKS
jgi:hypothetical protein